jgi:hypothetical protein
MESRAEAAAIHQGTSWQKQSEQKENYSQHITVQKEQSVRLVSLMQREIILYMASAICVSSCLADFYVLSKFASLE